MPFLKLIFCVGKLSDVMYVPPWRIVNSKGEGKSKSFVSGHITQL